MAQFYIFIICFHKLYIFVFLDGSELVLDEVDASDPEHADDENEEMEEILDADMMLIEEEEQLEAASESVFDLQIFVDKLAAPATMHALFLALGEFDRNPERVTHCTMRLLHALTFARARPDPSAPIDAEPFDSDKAAADAAIGHLFQLRLLVIFRKLLSNKLYASLSEYKVCVIEYYIIFRIFGFHVKFTSYYLYGVVVLNICKRRN